MSTLPLVARNPDGTAAYRSNGKSFSLALLGKNANVVKSGSPKAKSSYKYQNPQEIQTSDKIKQMQSRQPQNQMNRIAGHTPHTPAPNPVPIFTGNTSSFITVIKSKQPDSHDHPNMFEIDLSTFPKEKLTTYNGVKSIYEAIQTETELIGPQIAKETHNGWFKDTLIVPVRIDNDLKVFDRFMELSRMVMLDNADSGWRYPYSNKGTKNEGKLPELYDDPMNSSMYFRKVYFNGDPYKFSA